MLRHLRGGVFSIAVAAGTACSALAGNLLVERTTFMAPLLVNGSAPEIAGIHSGMSAADALRTLAGLDGVAEITRIDSKLVIGKSGSRPFAALYHSWSNPSEQVNVYLTSPASGSEVFAVTRKQAFDEIASRPDYETLLGDLEIRYGPAQAIVDRLADPRSLLSRSRTTTLSWYFGGRRSCAFGSTDHLSTPARLCNTTMHRTGEAALDLVSTPDRIAEYRLAAEAGTEVIIVATLRNDGGERPVTSLTVSLVDLRRRLVATEADIAAGADRAEIDRPISP